MMKLSAMIFAAGFGTRMGALTRTIPKPMLELGGKPMIDRVVDLVRAAGITDIVVNTHYLHDLLEAHAATLGVRTLYEPSILETGGGLKAALPFLDSDPVVTINPDAVWFGPNPIVELCKAWRPDMTALLMCVREDGVSDFSIENGCIRRGGPYRYTGAQIIRVDRLNEIQKDAFSLNEYWDLLMRHGPVHGLVHPGTWIDVGTPAGLKRANDALKPT